MNVQLVLNLEYFAFALIVLVIFLCYTASNYKTYARGTSSVYIRFCYGKLFEYS